MSAVNPLDNRNKVVPGNQYWKSSETSVWELVEAVSVEMMTGMVNIKDASGEAKQAYEFELFPVDEHVVNDMTSLYHIHEVSGKASRPSVRVAMPRLTRLPPPRSPFVPFLQRA